MTPPPDLLAQRLRDEDDRAIAEAYRRTFDGEVGRLVLAHILLTAGVGLSRGPDFGAEARAWVDGRQALAIEVMNLAKFDQPSAVATVLAGSNMMEGRDHERDDDRSGFSRPDERHDLDD
jgi:hypothetical protein